MKQKSKIYRAIYFSWKFPDRFQFLADLQIVVFRCLFVLFPHDRECKLCIHIPILVVSCSPQPAGVSFDPCNRRRVEWGSKRGWRANDNPVRESVLQNAGRAKGDLSAVKVELGARVGSQLPASRERAALLLIEHVVSVRTPHAFGNLLRNPRFIRDCSVLYGWSDRLDPNPAYVAVPP